MFWLRELGGKGSTSTLAIGSAVLALALVITAVFSTWTPPPNQYLYPDLTVH